MLGRKKQVIRDYNPNNQAVVTDRIVKKCASFRKSESGLVGKLQRRVELFWE
jgi:hypothetical protein